MKIPYTFSVLRYRHDMVSGEFVNVGIVVYASLADFFEIKCLRSLGRVSRFFGSANSVHLKRVLPHITETLRDEWEMVGDGENRREGQADDFDADLDSWQVRTERKVFRMLLNAVLPQDDSALQFSPPLGGVTADPQGALEALYERYVERYARSHYVASRSDGEVKQTFHNALSKRCLLHRVRPKKITSANYEHEFPYSWRNGILNASEAVSFDLVEPSSILEKANRWLGRAISLSESTEEFKLYLLLGEPGSEKLQQTFAKAENILSKIPCRYDLIHEKDADSFAEYVQMEIAQSPQT